jgi:hypothetical protein
VSAAASAWSARIDRFTEFVGLDVTKMYPPPGIPRDQQLIDNWTSEYFLTAAEKCFKGRPPVRPDDAAKHGRDALCEG